MTGFTYKSYNFVDKDPIIDYVRTVVQDSHMTYKYIADASGVNPNTISKMLDGETRRPQAATVNAILRACGMKLAVRPLAEVETVQATMLTFFPQLTPKSKSTKAVRHVVQMHKYRKTRKTG